MGKLSLLIDGFVLGSVFWIMLIAWIENYTTVTFLAGLVLALMVAVTFIDWRKT